MKKFLQEFKAFAMRGNVMDMAVGVMVGGAFSKIVTSLVNDLFMPLIGLILGGFNLSGAFLALDFQSYPSIEAAQAAGVGTLCYGQFLQAVIDFVLTALCVFLVIKLIGRLHRRKEEAAPAPAPRLCPFCKTEIALDATRCPHCTSRLDGAADE